MIESTSSSKLTFDKMSSTYPFSAPAETHKRSEKVTTVTIEFERMPGLGAPVTLVFEKIANITYCYYDCGSIYFRDWANCHPRDTFTWEVGMRLAAKRACLPEAYRAFRRWMWLAKEQHKARKLILRGDIVTLPVMMATDMIITNIIAREFGRVTVRVT